MAFTVVGWKSSVVQAIVYPLVSRQGNSARLLARMTTHNAALITGNTRHYGSYLTELLLEKGYAVHGINRRANRDGLRPASRTTPRGLTICTRIPTSWISSSRSTSAT